MRQGYYVLDENHNATPVSVMEWALWLEKNNSRRVVKQERIGRLFISTVFLGLDYQYSDSGVPLIFESMIFEDSKGGLEEYQDRCSTWDEALEMHDRAMEYAHKRVQEMVSIADRVGLRQIEVED